MVFETEDKLSMETWQFITFLLDKIWWRTYSILEIVENKIILIIKKWELENGGRWGSKLICELNIWDILKWVWPAWNFTLKENNKNKLFLWTWTWFVPLYNQIIWWLDKDLNCKFKLIFWARKKQDLFYIEKLKKLKEKYQLFDFEVYLSREDSKEYNKWYTTNFLTDSNIKEFKEFYICWAPGVIESSTTKLNNLGIKKENIFTEKY
jgi:NAD(P)H-flavin reductase